jgi:hypothetical protein
LKWQQNVLAQLHFEVTLIEARARAEVEAFLHIWTAIVNSIQMFVSPVARLTLQGEPRTIIIEHDSATRRKKTFANFDWKRAFV